MSGRVVTLGETMGLLRAESIGSLAHLGSLAIGVGGSESNVAIALRRLGVDAVWVGRVGDDGLGVRVARELRAEGVEAHAIVDESAPTGLMLKQLPAAGRTAVRYYRGGSAGSRLGPADLPPDLIEGADLLHVTGITPLLSASCLAAVHAAIDCARERGATVSFDVNHRAALGAAESAAPVLRELADRADLLFGGEEELRLVGGAGADAAELAESLAGDGRTVIAKLGAAGAVAVAEGRTVAAEGFAVPVVDTVGAGDAFVAGYLSAHLAGLPLEQRLRRGNACGALLCTAPGDWEASPTLRDIDRLLRGGGDPVER